ncbi:MAG: hypothetical protein ACXWXR_03700 [Candidatus Limnocylindrales bacterium]
MGGSPARRQPAWSGPLTKPLATRIPTWWRPGVLAVIKFIHTAVFFSVAALIALFPWDGIRRRPRRRTALAGVVALTETAVFASNNQVCPLTPLAEELGAASASVTDIYLPGWLSWRIPLISGTALIVGMLMNVQTLGLGRRREAADSPPERLGFRRTHVLLTPPGWPGQLHA